MVFQVLFLNHVQRSLQLHGALVFNDLWVVILSLIFGKNGYRSFTKYIFPVENYDDRPIALTSCVMKCFERFMVSLLKTEVKPIFDTFQFAYGQGRGAVDAINNLCYSQH